jgi:1-deoxy-D-xylulose-5-phosphate synthase
MRIFPNFVVMAPGDERDVAPMMKFMLDHNGPIAMRYPKANLENVERAVAPVQLGQAEVIDWGMDGAIVAYGTMMPMCVRAAEQLRKERGLDIGVINARFFKPLDTETILRAVRELPFVLTIEEGTVVGGFGSAVLEAASDAGIDTSNITRLGLPDRFVEHAERHELLHDLGLDEAGVMQTVIRLTERAKTLKPKTWTKELTA